MNESEPQRVNNVVNLDDWKRKRLSKLNEYAVLEDKTLFRENLIRTMREYIAMLEHYVALRKRVVELNKSTLKLKKQYGLENQSGLEQRKIQIDKDENDMKRLQEHADIGKFLLTTKDTEDEELVEYLDVNIKSFDDPVN
jgi:hypothetical protein